MDSTLLHNPHVGEILKQDFLEEFNLTEVALAKAIGLEASVIKEIIQFQSIITADIDLRLCRYFNLSEGYFLRLQNAYQILEAKRKLGNQLTKITPI